MGAITNQSLESYQFNLSSTLDPNFGHFSSKLAVLRHIYALNLFLAPGFAALIAVHAHAHVVHNLLPRKTFKVLKNLRNYSLIHMIDVVI